MVGGGENGKDNLLARVSVVNKFNEVLYDTFVKPLEAVTDYRTQFSGVRESDLATGNFTFCYFAVNPSTHFQNFQLLNSKMLKKRLLS